jgi:hypothetical protein
VTDVLIPETVPRGGDTRQVFGARSTASNPASWPGTAAAYAILLRVPLLIGATLFLLPIFALGPSFAKPVLENLFVLDPLGTFITVFAAFSVSWSVLLTTLVVLVNAEERFGISRSLSQDTLRSKERIVRWIIAGLLLTLSAPMIFGQFLQPEVHPVNWDSLFYWNLLMVGTGGVVAYGLAYVALIVVMLVSPTVIEACTEIFPGPALLRTWLRYAHDRRLFHGEWPRVRAFLLRLPSDVRSGYIDDRETIQNSKQETVDNGARGLPWSGVWLTVSFWAVTVVVYLLIDLYKQWSPAARTLPALGFVLLLLMNVNWFLAALTFFYDRFRTPLLGLFVLAAVMAVYLTSSSDNYYRLQPGVLQSISPHQVLAQRIADEKPIIVVTTAGGGIQANAWTVRVLAGLQSFVPGGKFADSVTLVSSVSGGATGALFFLSQYHQGADAAHGGFSPEKICKKVSAAATVDECLMDIAERPGLDDVAWALAYRDVPRVVFPYFTGVAGRLFSKLGTGFLKLDQEEGLYLDRGRMLERSWAQRGISGKLSDWQAGLTEGWRPASIFNSTIAETGEAFLFSTTDFGSADAPSSPEHEAPTGRRRPQTETFKHSYPSSDVDLVTAARLASGFPFVLPAARPLHTSKSPDDESEQSLELRRHLIDGGYYDNYGVDSAVQWLDEALQHLRNVNSRLPREILIVQIRSFPGKEVSTASGPSSSADPPPLYRGWPFQLIAPVVGLLNVRSTGQLLHDRYELSLLQDKWGTVDFVNRAGQVEHRPRIRFAGFEFQDHSAPLSFAMNEKQKRSIDKVWNCVLGKERCDSAKASPVRQSDLTQVECLFDPALPECAGVVKKKPW